ncbi:unnamed protein product [Caenorhabditis angaria]|uniref:Uncharacterized protein n=1 Tax=Caenorhabditis angaria TaxID=860376 RepID=A0A9P1N3M3_9PELO|nr:unnamed protein product [Caenorhabditis angaria]
MDFSKDALSIYMALCPSEAEIHLQREEAVKYSRLPETSKIEYLNFTMPIVALPSPHCQQHQRQIWKKRKRTSRHFNGIDESFWELDHGTFADCGTLMKC